MYIYISLFVFFVGSLAFAKNKRTKSVILITLWLLASLLIGFRGQSVGIDTAEYFNIYSIIKYDPNNLYITRKIQPLYIAINNVADFLNGGASLALFISAAITLYFIISTIMRISSNAALSIAIFFSLELFFFMHNGVRQALAVAVVFYSIRFIFSKQPICFLVMIFISIMFHASAVICLPFYFINKLSVNYKWFIFSWLISIVFFIDSSLVFYLYNFVVPYLPNQYESFSSLDDLYENASQGLGLGQLFKQFLFIIILYTYSKIDSKNDENSIVLIALISIIFSNIFYHIGLINRINSYLSIFLILAIPIAINFSFRMNNRRIVNTVLYIAFFLIYLKGIYTDGHSVFPYYNVLFE